MVEITMGGWGNSFIYRVILSFCFYCVHSANNATICIQYIENAHPVAIYTINTHLYIPRVRESIEPNMHELLSEMKSVETSSVNYIIYIYIYI